MSTLNLLQLFHKYNFDNKEQGTASILTNILLETAYLGRLEDRCKARNRKTTRRDLRI